MSKMHYFINIFSKIARNFDWEGPKLEKIVT